MPGRVIVGFGSNLGHRIAHLRAGLALLRTRTPGATWQPSPVYECAPVGFAPGGKDGPAAPDAFLNAVVVGDGVETPPTELLGILLAIERERGRRRPDVTQDSDAGASSTGPTSPALATVVAYASRPFDGDLVDYGGITLDDESPASLQLPHPRAHERWFVMRPLADVLPDWRHPVLGRTADELVATLAPGGHVYSAALE